MKKFFSILLVVALMLVVTGCGAKPESADASADRIAQLEQENAALQAQVNSLTAEIENMKQSAALQDWTLDATAWSDGNGATVTFTAIPVSYTEGLRAALSVRMGDLEAESTNCIWDGSAFTGSVELSAADGYSYYCILTNPDGSQGEIALNSPERITNETLVYLGSNLSAYANLIVEDWEATATTLTIKSGYIQCQTPRLTFNNMTANVSKADLVLKLNDEEIARQEISLPAGEGEGSFETTIANLSFSMPSMEDDYQLDLWLEISLNTGNTVSVSGGSWYNSDGTLQLVVG